VIDTARGGYKLKARSTTSIILHKGNSRRIEKLKYDLATPSTNLLDA